jgi:UDP-glucose 4-epimerase
MKKVLVIGKNSFLASNFIARNSEKFEITGISHGEDLNALDLDEFSGVVNMAYDPDYFKTKYAVSRDFDVHVAKALKGKRPHFFMMSSRKVYGAIPPFPVDESAPLVATDPYGANKAITEAEVQRILGANCTILRIANIFGFERGRHTFLGVALTKLKEENRIVLDVSPFTMRDFLPVESFADMLGDVVEASPGGIFNMGSSQALPIGQIALWIIEGYGSGELVVNATGERDRFLLSCEKLHKAVGSTQKHMVDMHQSCIIQKSCIDIGRRLRDA